MPSVFSTRFHETASPRLRDHLGEVVAILRGEVETSGVSTIIAEQEYEGDGEEFKTTLSVTDFLIYVGDYEFGAGSVEPRKNDRIKRTIDGTTHTYEVMPAPNGRVAEWANTANDEWTVHTKHIDP